MASVASDATSNSRKSKVREELQDIEVSIEEKKRHEYNKAKLKETETLAEKRARRLAKKQAKELHRKAEMGWDKEYLGYSNRDNPFGDEHLLDSFVWNKKLEKEGKTDLEKYELDRLQRQRMYANKQELELVKQRRIERERELEERERNREIEMRETESDFFKEWAKNEDTFHLKQAKIRSKIRIENGRAKPIDLLARYIGADDGDSRAVAADLSIDMHVSYRYMDGLVARDLEDLIEDIAVYQELHKENVSYQQFWNDILLVAKDELMKLDRVEGRVSEEDSRRRGVNEAVERDVSSIFAGKTSNQLQLLRRNIEAKLSNPAPGVDVGYWETLQQQLEVHLARTRLEERHEDVLRDRLHKLREEQRIDEQALFPVAAPHDAAAAPADSAPPDADPSDAFADCVDEEADAETLAKRRREAYTAGNFSPKLIQTDDMAFDYVVYEPIDDVKKLAYQRNAVQKTGKTRLDSEAEFMRSAAKSMDEALEGGADSQFSVEVPIAQTFLWSDKYKPRKPRFFNRVHTGYEWNKYNQTHYDVDNPPPKVVQGYKFNIYYPDLIDKSKPPKFELLPEADNDDFVTIKFVAGPPYEDIAFRIVHREWNTRHYKGFRCQFHNGIFQLWFHFEKFRYRK